MNSLDTLGIKKALREQETKEHVVAIAHLTINDMISLYYQILGDDLTKEQILDTIERKLFNNPLCIQIDK